MICYYQHICTFRMFLSKTLNSRSFCPLLIVNFLIYKTVVYKKSFVTRFIIRCTVYIPLAIGANLSKTFSHVSFVTFVSALITQSPYLSLRSFCWVYTNYILFLFIVLYSFVTYSIIYV